MSKRQLSANAKKFLHNLRLSLLTSDSDEKYQKLITECDRLLTEFSNSYEAHEFKKEMLLDLWVFAHTHRSTKKPKEIAAMLIKALQLAIAKVDDEHKASFWEALGDTYVSIVWDDNRMDAAIGAYEHAIKVCTQEKSKTDKGYFLTRVYDKLVICYLSRHSPEQAYSARKKADKFRHYIELQ